MSSHRGEALTDVPTALNPSSSATTTPIRLISTSCDAWRHVPRPPRAPQDPDGCSRAATPPQRRSADGRRHQRDRDAEPCCGAERCDAAARLHGVLGLGDAVGAEQDDGRVEIDDVEHQAPERCVAFAVLLTLDDLDDET